MSVRERVREIIRDVPDFPKKGIVFKDISPILLNAGLSKDVVQQIREDVGSLGIQGIAGIESRGFLFGAALAMEMDVPFVLIRKKGKLPYKTVSQTYELEYGTAEIEMHIDAVQQGQKILIHDDLLATGGSASAAAELIKRQGAEVIGFNFLVELSFLNGRDKISTYSENITNLVRY